MIWNELGDFIKRLENGDLYDDPAHPDMTDMIIKMMIELLSVLTLATKQTDSSPSLLPRHPI